ncbi:MAG: hypothetical protein Q8O37_08520 [Sulfuricellaceae bacterium]|nr:hypothetical protein [Sulfuricellaceae bacterium]
MSHKYGAALVSAWLLVAASPCLSDEADTANSSRLSLKGFGTLGFARSDDDSIQFVRDLTQPDGLTHGGSGKTDSILGLQANLKLTEQTEGVMQVVSRYRYDGAFTPEVTWAFLRQDISPDISFRFGRMGTEFYMLADSRLVGYANLTVRPPQDYYGPLVLAYIDGVDVSAATPLADGLLRGKLYAGISPETTPFVKPLTWDLDGSAVVGGHVDYLRGPWQIRLSHAQIRFENELPTDALIESQTGIPNFLSYVPELSVVGKWSRFDSLGAVYDDGPLQLQLMASQIRHESAAYEDSKAGYAIAAYRLNDVTPYVGYSYVKSSPQSVNAPPQLADLTASLVAETHSNQHTIFLGGRWDFQSNLALKAQIDWIRGAPDSVFPFREGNGVTWDGSMTIFSMALDFVF